MGCELGMAPFYEIKSPEPVPGYRLVFPYFRFRVSMRAPFSCLSMCVVTPGQLYYGICPLWGGDWVLLLAIQEGFMQDNWPASEAERDLLTLGHPCLALELILLFPFCVSKALSLPAPGWVVLSWWFLYQDAVDRVFGLLFLVIHDRCHLLVTLWNMFLPWNWKWKGSWLSLFPNFVWIS